MKESEERSSNIDEQKARIGRDTKVLIQKNWK